MGRSKEARRLGLGDRGTTIPEVLVTFGVIALSLSTSVLALNASFEDRRTATQALVGDLRQARMNAVTRGAHYRLIWTGNTYLTERLQDDDGDGVWRTDPGATPQSREVRGATIETSSGDPAAAGVAGIEFDTRGMVVAAGGGEQREVIEITITERGNGSLAHGASYVEVWPSGQVYVLSARERR